MPKCVFKSCGNNYRTKNISHGLSYFGFPEEPILCSKWISVVSEETQDFRLTKYSKVCSEHFDERDIIGYNTKRRQLVKTAIPKSQVPNSRKNCYSMDQYKDLPDLGIEKYIMIPCSKMKTPMLAFMVPYEDHRMKANVQNNSELSTNLEKKRKRPANTESQVYQALGTKKQKMCGPLQVYPEVNNMKKLTIKEEKIDNEFEVSFNERRDLEERIKELPKSNIKNESILDSVGNLSKYSTHHNRCDQNHQNNDNNTKQNILRNTFSNEIKDNTLCPKTSTHLRSYIRKNTNALTSTLSIPAEAKYSSSNDNQLPTIASRSQAIPKDKSNERVPIQENSINKQADTNNLNAVNIANKISHLEINLLKEQTPPQCSSITNIQILDDFKPYNQTNIKVAQPPAKVLPSRHDMNRYNYINQPSDVRKPSRQVHFIKSKSSRPASEQIVPNSADVSKSTTQVNLKENTYQMQNLQNNEKNIQRCSGPCCLSLQSTTPKIPQIYSNGIPVNSINKISTNITPSTVINLPATEVPYRPQTYSSSNKPLNILPNHLHYQEMARSEHLKTNKLSKRILPRGIASNVPNIQNSSNESKQTATIEKIAKLLNEITKKLNTLT